jgi:hypothetical protein
MNDLYAFHVQHRNARVMHKWDHYFEVYERFLAPIRHTRPVVLEIGVQLGGSVEMWRYYFGPAARIFGIDINPEAKQQEDIATGFSSVISRTAGFFVRCCARSAHPTW